MRRERRIRVDGKGRLEIVDPGFDSLELLQAIDPAFEVRKALLPGFVSAGLNRMRNTRTGLTPRELALLSNVQAWELHDRLMRADSSPHPATPGDNASLLDLKAMLAVRLLSACVLCARRCGVDRTMGELGACRLGSTALVAEHFIHIGEEPPINPSFVLNMVGCALRCRYCQQGQLLDPSRCSGDDMDGSLWNRVDMSGARSISFVGGNPDESLPAILGALRRAPRWELPLVWNNHSYCSREALALLEGVVDAYVPDFKYGNEACARDCSGVTDYPATALHSISRMVAQDVPVLVRILVLPGHVECCHLPSLNALASLECENLWVSIRDQYSPDWKVKATEPALSRRANAEEIAAVRDHAHRVGLRPVDPGTPCRPASTAVMEGT